MKVTHGHEPGGATDVRGPTFTNTVYADPVITGMDAVMVNAVFFPPGARTHWHTHESGQLLFVTQGSGFAGTRAGDAQPLAPGDVVWFAPGEEHWHGAGPDTSLGHTAVSLGVTSWLDELGDADFRATIA
jgi:quercetin dioxygenase-like cupin family protein